MQKVWCKCRACGHKWQQSINPNIVPFDPWKGVVCPECGGDDFTLDEAPTPAAVVKIGRGGYRAGAGRPSTTLVIKLSRDWMKRLEEFSRSVSLPPDECAANLIMAHLERRKQPMPTPDQAQNN